MRNLIRSITSAAISAALAFTSTSGLYGQGVTSSALQGTLTDSSGKPVAGAQIVAVHTPSGTTYNTVTRSNGLYNLNNLRVGGPYSVTATSGADAKRITNVYADLGQVTQVDVRLSPAQAPVTSAVGPVVAGEPGRVIVEASLIDDETFSPTRAGTATTVQRQQIDKLPTISRSLQDFTRLTPQVVGGTVSSTNNRFNNITVDGATINDAFGLSASGVLTDRAEPISLDAVETFRVNIAPYDLKYSGFTGGSIDAVTRSGTNTWTGSIYGFYRGANLIGNFRQTNAFTGLSPISGSLYNFEEYTYGARLAGPIIKDTLFFFILGESKRRKEPQLGSIGSSTTFSATQAQFDQVISISTTRYGYNPGTAGAILDNVNDDKITAKLDWNITKGQKLTLTYKYVNADYTDGITRNNNSFALTGLQFDRPFRSNSYVGQLFSTWTPTFTTEARVAYNTLKTERTVSTPFPYINGVQVSTGNRINFGVERSSQENALDQDIIESVFNASYYIGSHTIGGGVGVDHYAFRNLFIQDAFGTYDFGSSPLIPAGPGGFPPAIPARTGIENFQAGLASRYRHSYSNIPGVAAPIAEFDYFSVGAYVQDEWKVTPRVTLQFGVRMDVPLYSSTPLYNPQFFTDYGLKTSQLPDSKVIISPRLGFNWNVFGTDFTSTENINDSVDPKTGVRLPAPAKPWYQIGTVFRGGIGVFNGTTPRVFLSNQFSNTGVDISRIDVNLNPPANSSLRDPRFFVADPFNQPIAGQNGLSAVRTTAIALASTNFVFPQNLRGNFAIDQRLPFNFVLTLEGIYTKALEAVQFQNLNLSSQTGTLPDGRPVYGGLGPVGVDPRRNYTSVILMSNTSQGNSYSGAVTLELPRTKSGIYFKTAYVYSRAYSVNDASSSVAVSNYEFNPIGGNPNQPGLARSFFETRHRFIAAFDYQFALKKKWETTIGLFLERRSGTPYTFVFTNDANKDGQFSNDLVYVPRDVNDVVVRTGLNTGGLSAAQIAALNADAAAAFNNLIERNPFLRANRGKILPRFGGTNPFITRLDLRFTQNIPVPYKGHLEFYYDILNIPNLLASKSGLIQSWGGSTFGTPGLVSNNNGGTTVVNGVTKSVYLYTPGVGELSVANGVQNIDSRWQMQFGLRYSF